MQITKCLFRVNADLTIPVITEKGIAPYICDTIDMGKLEVVLDEANIDLALKIARQHLKKHGGNLPPRLTELSVKISQSKAVRSDLKGKVMSDLDIEGVWYDPKDLHTIGADKPSKWVTIGIPTVDFRLEFINLKSETFRYSAKFVE